jgi:hypothetical protein
MSLSLISRPKKEAATHAQAGVNGATRTGRAEEIDKETMAVKSSCFVISLK